MGARLFMVMVWAAVAAINAAPTAQHWAYQKPQRPALPHIDSNWPRNAIDQFVLAKLRANKLQPSPEARPGQLLRRVHLDLIGLPPSPAVLEAFLKNPSAKAYEKIVDRLLKNPQYGERWARPWLDLARYADSNGYQADQLRDSWAYRDWVIDAFNKGMPFNQFVIEQIAGDLLPKATAAQRIATGFHRTPTCNVEAGVHPEENRFNQVVDRVNTTGTVFLGTTLECAQCHDHKYDPIAMKEYYSLFAFFNNTPLEVKQLGKGVTWDFYGPTMELPIDAARAAKLKKLNAQMDAAQTKVKALRKDLAEEPNPPKNIAAILRKSNWSKKEKATLEKHFKIKYPILKKEELKVLALAKQINTLKPPTTLVMMEREKPRKTHVMRRGSYLSPGNAVASETPTALHPFKKNWPRNRLGLANWLVDADNPLVARVTVNRWWAEIMGRGLVATQEDFGKQSKPPTHPKLLDWLAVEFMERDWSMKHIHKLIVMSATYRQSSRVTPALLAADAANKFYARAARLRMSAEMVRDNALAISGLLSTKMHGPPIYPPQPGNIWRHVGRNGPKFNVATDENRFRRGVYVVWRRGAPYASFVNFDAPDRGTCVVQRPRTNTPLQALTLMNDEAYVEMALAFAGRVLAETKAGPEAKIEFAFKAALSRSPRPAELKFVKSLLLKRHAYFEKNTKAATEIIGNVKGWKAPKGLDTGELAAWFFIANILLNLDETITKQ
ncbi:MAG TPA: DUF1553 domain-containing protein [Verrucomicrobiales bacterium]|nr:DUF1553 domain-containing protein [Verrucomicrobiales bacterium]